MAYNQNVLFVETPIFTKQVLSSLSDEGYRQLQQALLERPDIGKIIPGSGGLRKIRWKAEGRGKRGGVRIIYYWLQARETVLFLFMYPKNVRDNLTQSQLKQLRKIIEEEYRGR